MFSSRWLCLQTSPRFLPLSPRQGCVLGRLRGRMSWRFRSESSRSMPFCRIRGFCGVAWSSLPSPGQAGLRRRSRFTPYVRSSSQRKTRCRAPGARSSIRRPPSTRPASVRSASISSGSSSFALRSRHSVARRSSSPSRRCFRSWSSIRWGRSGARSTYRSAPGVASCGDCPWRLNGTRRSVLLVTDAREQRALPLPVAQRIELSQPSSGKLGVRVAKDRRGRITQTREVACRNVA